MTSILKRVKSARMAAYVALLVGGAATGVLAPLAWASTQNEEEFGAPPSAVRDRKQSIDAELKQLQGHPWAGEYYEGDGLGTNISLTLAPHAGVAATWMGCMGLYGANEGSIKEHPDGHLFFQFNRPNAKKFGGFPNEVVPVRWGDRRYLIPSSAMLDFVNAINHGDEPRAGSHGRFLLARGDEAKAVNGLPAIADRLLQSIRHKALEVGVVKVESRPDNGSGDYCEKHYRVTVDHGKADGLVPGIELKVQSPVSLVANLRISSSKVGTAVGDLAIFETNCRHPQSVPDRHWTFTTGAYDVAAAK